SGHGRPGRHVLGLRIVGRSEQHVVQWTWLRCELAAARRASARYVQPAPGRPGSREILRTADQRPIDPRLELLVPRVERLRYRSGPAVDRRGRRFVGTKIDDAAPRRRAARSGPAGPVAL